MADIDHWMHHSILPSVITVYSDDAATLGSILRGYSDRDLNAIGQIHRQRQHQRKRQPTKIYHLSTSDDSSSNDNSASSSRSGPKAATSTSLVSQEPTANEVGVAFNDNELELNKLLKCNYSGVSNLYWCGNEV